MDSQSAESFCTAGTSGVAPAPRLRNDSERSMTFSMGDDLPIGTTVIEASAGTGKTYAIVGLAARYVAQGIPLSALMLVTFGRAATQELRDRARDRLRSSADALADPETARESADVVIRTLATGTDTEVD